MVKDLEGYYRKFNTFGCALEVFGGLWRSLWNFFTNFITS